MVSFEIVNVATRSVRGEIAVVLSGIAPVRPAAPETPFSWMEDKQKKK